MLDGVKFVCNTCTRIRKYSGELQIFMILFLSINCKYNRFNKTYLRQRISKVHPIYSWENVTAEFKFSHSVHEHLFCNMTISTFYWSSQNELLWLLWLRKRKQAQWYIGDHGVCPSLAIHLPENTSPGTDVLLNSSKGMWQLVDRRLIVDFPIHI